MARIGDAEGGDRKHQWGAETSTQPLAIMHAKPSPTRVVLGYVAIICTVVSWLIYMITMILSLFVNNPSLTLRFVVEGVLYMTIVTTLIFSALVYLTTRQGALYRFIRHERVPRAMLDDHFAHNYDKGITVLIPSYSRISLLSLLRSLTTQPLLSSSSVGRVRVVEGTLAPILTDKAKIPLPFNSSSLQEVRQHRTHNKIYKNSFFIFY